MVIFAAFKTMRALWSYTLVVEVETYEYNKCNSN